MAPPDTLTTEQVAEAAGVSVQTVRRWSRLGLLPPFRVVYGVRRGKQSYWPAHAAAQAAWIRVQNDAGRTFDEIRAALAAGEFTPPPRG